MEFNKKDSTLIDESNENFFVKKTPSDLAHEAAVAAIPCKQQDKPCMERWISSLSDCA